MGRQRLAELQVGHVGVGRIERPLKALFDVQHPVEVERVVALAAEQAHILEPARHLPRHFGRVVDDDLVMPIGRLTQGRAHERMQLLQVRRRALRPGQHHGERQVAVGGVHQNAQQVEEFFGRTGAAREDDDAVADAHKSLQALFDVRQDHQFVDDRVRRLGGNDAWLGQAQVAAARQALFGVGNGGALHGALHYAGAATRANVQLAQAQLVAHLFGVFVLVGVDRVAAPAHHHLGLHTGAQGACVAQQVEHIVGDALGIAEVDALAVQFAFGVNDVAQGAEQHLAGTGDHFAVDERIGRRVQQFKAHAAVLLMDAYLEILVGFQDSLGIVDMGAGVEDGQGALAKEGVGAARAGSAELLDFALGQGLQAALGADRGIDDVSLSHTLIP